MSKNRPMHFIFRFLTIVCCIWLELNKKSTAWHRNPFNIPIATIVPCILWFSLEKSWKLESISLSRRSARFPRIDDSESSIWRGRRRNAVCCTVPHNWKLRLEEIHPDAQVRMRHPQVKLEREEMRGDLVWGTGFHCEYQLLQMTRTLQLTPGTENAKVLKYGMTREGILDTKNLCSLKLFKISEPFIITRWKTGWAGGVQKSPRSIPPEIEFELPIRFHDIESIFLANWETWCSNSGFQRY